MKSDEIQLYYRSLSRPDPLWVEQGLYGGYQYIAVAEGTWLPREYEALVALQMLDIPEGIKRTTLAAIKPIVKMFKPLRLQESNYVKLVRLIAHTKTFGVIGATALFEHVLSQVRYTKIYTSEELSIPNTIKVTEQQLLAATAHMLVFIPESFVKAKGDIANWGNVVVYNADMLIADDTQQQEVPMHGKQLTIK